MSSSMRRIPYGADAPVRKRQDIERNQKEQAASRGLAASQIGSGGTLKVDGSLQVTGSITVPGTLSSAGAVSAGTTVTAGTNLNAGGNLNAVDGNLSGFLYVPSAPGNVLTGTRAAGWWLSSNGQAGTATSSERFKDNIRPVLDDPEFDPLAVLELEIDYWEYVAEIRKRDDPNFVEYVGPDYHVALNFGPIAERVHELGLWMIVIYERDVAQVYDRPLDLDSPMRYHETLRLDEAGEPIPFALHDSLFGYVLQMAVKRVREEQLRDRALLEAVAKEVGIDRSTVRGA